MDPFRPNEPVFCAPATGGNQFLSAQSGLSQRMGEREPVAVQFFQIRAKNRTESDF